MLSDKVETSARHAPSLQQRILSTVIETQHDLSGVELEPITMISLTCARAQEMIGADGAMVELVEGDDFICEGNTGVLADSRGRRYPQISTMSGTAAATGQTQQCSNCEEHDNVNQPGCKVVVRSILAVPLEHGGKIAGVMSVVSARMHAFDSHHVLGLQMIAGVLATALSHAAELEAKRKLLSDRTLAISALRESEERFRSAFDHAAIGKAIVALDGRFLQVNCALCRIVGYTEQELLVCDFQSITHPDDLDTDLTYVRQMIAGEIVTYEMVKRYIHRQGHIVWVNLNVSVVRDDRGKPLYFIGQIQDITKRQEMELALRASENEYRATFERDNVGKAQTDLATLRFVRVNSKLCKILGYTSNELLALSIEQITHPDDLPQGMLAVQKMLDGTMTEFDTEKRYIRKDGQIIWVSLNAALIRDLDGKPRRAVETIQDISDRKRNEWLEMDRRKVLEMVARDRPLAEVLESLAGASERQIRGATAAVLLLSEGRIATHAQNLSLEWRKLIERDGLRFAADLAGDAWQATSRCGVTSLDQYRSTMDVEEFQSQQVCWSIPIQSSDNSSLGLLTLFIGQRRGPTHAEIQTLDMCAQLAAICIDHHNTTRQLAHLVRHDTLTGLPNRVMFEDRVQQALALAKRSGKLVGVMVLDIDKFKTINDTYGHQAGDNLLQQFAQRLSSRLRQSDTMARVGGDEFVIVLPELEKSHAAAVVAKKLVDCLAEPFDLGSHTISATTSIGVAMFPDDGDDAVALQKNADAALYRAKQAGRNRFALCSL